MRTTTNTTDNDPTTERANVPARDLLVAVDSALLDEERPVVTNADVAHHVFSVETPSRIQNALVADALSDLARVGCVGHDVIGGRDVWFAPNVEQYDEVTSAEGREGVDR